MSVSDEIYERLKEVVDREGRTRLPTFDLRLPDGYLRAMAEGTAEGIDRRARDFARREAVRQEKAR